MKKDEIQKHFEEIDNHVKDINRRMMLMCDKESSAKQRQAVNQGIAVIGKAVRHTKSVMGVG